MTSIMKKIALGSVAGLAIVGTAAAADLPVKAKAADYVKTCSSYGAGFYYVPGSDTCLKIGGYVIADTYFTEGTSSLRVRIPGFASHGSNSGSEAYFLSRGAITADARTQTGYGALRSFIELRTNYGNTDGIANEFSNDDIPSLSDYGARSGSSFELKFAYIQFAGFTFGRATSMFDFWAGHGWQGIQPGTFYSDVTTNLVAYTADFGNGFSATLSVEDQYTRDSQNAGPFYFVPGYDENQAVPDIVGNLAYEGSWGSAKLSGVYHDLRELTGFTGTDSTGWAVLAGVRVDVAASTTLYLEGVYSDGAVGYAGLGGYVPEVDAQGNAVSGWYVGGSLVHYWTPSVFTGVVGSYIRSDDYAVVNDVFLEGSTDFTGYNVGVNVGWIPVSGLTLVLQYDYLDAEYAFGRDAPEASQNLSYEQNRFTFSAKRSF